MDNKVDILGVRVDKVNIDEAVDKIFLMLDENKPHTVFTPNYEIILISGEIISAKKRLYYMKG